MVYDSDELGMDVEKVVEMSGRIGGF